MSRTLLKLQVEGDAHSGGCRWLLHRRFSGHLPRDEYLRALAIEGKAKGNGNGT